jgi:hypothetical protein
VPTLDPHRLPTASRAAQDPPPPPRVHARAGYNPPPSLSISSASAGNRRCQRPSFSPLHRRRVSTASLRPRYLARQVGQVPLVLTPQAKPPRSPGHASFGRAAVLVPGVVTASWAFRMAPSDSVSWATSPAGSGRACEGVGQKRPDTVPMFF